MTDTQTRAVERYLGGESGHRSFFGGTHSRLRIGLVIGFAILGLVFTPLLGAPALFAAVLGGGVAILVTARTHRGSIAERRTQRARWTRRVRLGTDAFVPYEVGAWDQLQKTAEDARKVRGSRGRTARWEAARNISAMRANPDGSDGLGWLQFAKGEPGIAWHAPMGEQEYLSVTFTVSGQLRGIESSAVLARAAHGWGAFLASRTAPSSLVGDVQVTTRVLPSDTALHEQWVRRNQDPNAPQDAVQSYDDVLRLTGQGAMVQRHFVTVKWPITGAFTNAALKYGDGREGWRSLMAQEIASTVRGLVDARMGVVGWLSAKQTGAVMLHMQNPSRTIDRVGDVSLSRLGVASHDEFSAHVVDGTDPETGSPSQWWHRTAAIRAEALSVGPRTQLWLLALLVGRDLPFARTLSFHIHLVSAAEAKAAAATDVVRDTAEATSRRDAGQLDSDDTELHLSAAKRRRRDLTAGSQHGGASWVGFVTISAQTREDLGKNSRMLEETCATSLGIEHLEWMDSYQAAASGTTWPIGRGMAPPAPSFSARVFDRMAGTSAKDSLS